MPHDPSEIFLICWFAAPEICSIIIITSWKQLCCVIAKTKQNKKHIQCMCMNSYVEHLNSQHVKNHELWLVWACWNLEHVI